MVAPGRPARPRIVVVGPVNMDLFIRGEAPLDRDALNVWVGSPDVELLVAGSIGYTLQVLARLDDDVVACTTIGSDAFGAHIRQELEASGVDCHRMTRAAGDTAIAIYMMLFGGLKRPLAVRMPGFEPWPDPPPLLDEGGSVPALVHSGGLLHFPAMWHRGLAGVFERARAAGALTSIDPQFPLVDTPAPWLPFAADVIAHSDVLLCDETEARMLFDVGAAHDAIAPAHAAGPRLVAIKRGAAGALVSDGRDVLDQPAVPVDPALIREAVGAGDAFDAGFLDALVRGGDIATAARWGTAAASLSLTGGGGARGIRDRRQVTERLSLVPPATSTGRVRP
jgi:sugar/nucleoside kinase (ribokinase family)